MTEQEAIKQIKSIPLIRLKQKQCDALEMSIEALEKQIPKKPLNKTSEFSGDYGNCPCCNTILCDFDNYNYCDKCGQKLDWGD